MTVVDGASPDLDRATPNSLLGVRHEGGPGDWRAVLDPGPWIADAAGVPHAGVLGVPIDIAFGIPLTDALPPGLAPLSTTISLDMVPGVDLFRGPLVATGEVVFGDERHGLCRGLVVDGAGRVVASGSMASVPRPIHPDFVPGSARDAEPDPAWNLERAFDGAPTPTADGAELAFRVGRRHENQRATFHGGMQFLLADIVARAALATDGGRWEPTSIRIDYLQVAHHGERVTMRAHTVRRGRSVALVSVECRTEPGTLVSRGTAAYLRMDVPVGARAAS